MSITSVHFLKELIVCDIFNIKANMIYVTVQNNNIEHEIRKEGTFNIYLVNMPPLVTDKTFHFPSNHFARSSYWHSNPIVTDLPKLL